MLRTWSLDFNWQYNRCKTVVPLENPEDKKLFVWTWTTQFPIKLFWEEAFHLFLFLFLLDKKKSFRYKLKYDIKLFLILGKFKESVRQSN